MVRVRPPPWRPESSISSISQLPFFIAPPTFSINGFEHLPDFIHPLPHHFHHTSMHVVAEIRRHASPSARRDHHHVAMVPKNGSPPASKAAVAALQEVTVTEAEETKECAICNDEMRAGTRATRMPCRHTYHGECIKRWLARRNSCPLCRFELPTDDAGYEARRRL
ncbi:E3 ubiquitin-protein ligase RING1-like [Acorus calamus]|uniref:RING-type E3 ubiquitin transferase n=1 Tax=Acorus calamus TaxID=4465 RepID=A0AAV9D7I3_ACOCL|nr:E3 ubiquitin-protein ligase RING1-like [Acorus calamus]